MSEVKAKTPHGEVTIDQLAEIQPGMAKIMKEVGERFADTYFAAKGRNWKLAAYHLNQVRTAFKVAKVTRPKFTEDLNAFDSEYLLPIFKAIQATDWSAFEDAFAKGMAGSDFYHDKTGHPYIRFVLPKERVSLLELGPPEKFTRRERGGKETPSGEGTQ
ncbi:MAG: hypothetical protein HY296_05165 [Thaumarchaeota archaeon]|nr:hypothetical protein [Nitrososphaerota archaeon]